jgi:hypothetical protein
VLAARSVEELKGIVTVKGITAVQARSGGTQREIPILYPQWAATVLPPGALRAVVWYPYDHWEYIAVYKEWTVLREGPSNRQQDEVLQTLRAISADVAQCLSPPAWQATFLPPARGSAGVAVFSRGETQVRVTGIISEERISAEVRVRPLVP